MTRGLGQGYDSASSSHGNPYNTTVVLLVLTAACLHPQDDMKSNVAGCVLVIIDLAS